MVTTIGLGIGAGLVSALLFALVVTGSVPGILLCYIAPLPIVIVALGWHSLVGLLAVATAGAVLSALVSSNAAIAYAFSAGVPAWGLSFLALSSRPSASAPAGAGPRAWLSPGRLLALTAAASALIAVASMVALGGGSYDAYHEMLYRLGAATLRGQLDTPAGDPLPTIAGYPGAVFVSGLVRAAPAVAACVFTVVTVLNLWLGARAVRTSGRLPRPWSPLPEARMPAPVTLAAAGAALLAFGHGWAGVVGAALFGALATAFALQGLALVHLATSGRPGRSVLLGFLYVLVLFFGGTVLPLLAIVGLVDSLTSLRSRFVRASHGPGDPPGPPSRPHR